MMSASEYLVTVLGAALASVPVYSLPLLSKAEMLTSAAAEPWLEYSTFEDS